MQNLQLVLKTVERCNLNCSYCYFFNGLDHSYVTKPKFISTHTIDNIVSFINQGVVELDIKEVSIVLHGGEPLMQPKQDFVYMMESFQKLLCPSSFTIQTNATLVTKKWTELLKQYNVHVGVSIDGPENINDKYRIDHQGNGSYARVLNGIKLLQDNLPILPSCLTVINPEYSGALIYKHLVGLGFKQLDFLLPDNCHDRPPPHSIDKYAQFLVTVFDEWTKQDDITISVRKLKSVLLQLVGQPSLIYGFGNINDDIPLLSIRSDGAVSPTDELMSTDPSTITMINKNVRDHSLQEVISSEIFNDLRKASTIAPIKCSKCCWYNACKGGGITNRFSKENKFNNPSVYCEALQKIFAHASAYLINSGVHPDIITNHLLS